MIYHIKDEKLIDVESIGARDKTYTDFLEILQNHKNECRYAVFDFPVTIPVEGFRNRGTQSKRCFTQAVMMFFKKASVGGYKYVQALDFEDASQEAIEDALRKGVLKQ